MLKDKAPVSKMLGLQGYFLQDRCSYFACNEQTYAEMFRQRLFDSNPVLYRNIYIQDLANDYMHMSHHNNFFLYILCSSVTECEWQLGVHSVRGSSRNFLQLDTSSCLFGRKTLTAMSYVCMLNDGFQSSDKFLNTVCSSRMTTLRGAYIYVITHTTWH